MKRDMDLVRTILKTCADATEPVDASVFVDETHSMQLIVYHFKIMSDAGLVESDINGTWNGSTIRASVKALTWDGNDFLDAVRSDSLWSKTKQRIAATVGSASFDVVKAVAVSLATTTLGL